MTPNGYVLWEGASLIDNVTPVVCIMTMHSSNEKTGDMVQTWILRQDMPPQDAVTQDKDEPICGSCIHRTLRTCYVNVWRGPKIVWGSWFDGKYPQAPENLRRLLRFRAVRIGAYGDPAAVPTKVWDSVAASAGTITGYTHHWRGNPHLASYCMASVESAEERAEAKALGFRTYRVLSTNEERESHTEAHCPASKESGKKLTCITCGYCNGNHTGLIGDVVIHAHGTRRKKYESVHFRAS